MSDPSRHFTLPCLLLALLSTALAFFAFHGAIEDLFRSWQTDEYSHGILLPFIALLLAWHRLVLVRPTLASSWLAVPVLGMAGGLLLVGTLAAFEAAAEYGLIVALAGLSLAFPGKAATRAMVPGFVCLLFAVPLPHIIHSNLSQQLQLISSTLGVAVLDLLGVPVFQEGNIIDLGGYRLQVAEACSGLRYLFPLMSFGYLLAYLLDDRWWKRLTVFLSVIPIAIAMNALRIAFVGVTVDAWGIGMAGGSLHEFEGWTVFLLCVALLLAEIFLLLRVGPRGRFRLDYLGPARGAIAAGRLGLRPPMFAAIALTAVFAVLFGTGAVDRRGEITPPHRPFSSFPLTIGAWHGQPQTLPAEVLGNLQLSDYWIADYHRAADPAPVNFYMAYYAHQRVGSEAHSPSNCIPGGGWQIVSEKAKRLTLSGGRRLNVTRLLIRRAGVTQLVYYWFDERGRDITDTYRAKWYLLTDSLTLHRTDGGLVRLVTPLAQDESEEAGEKRLDGFLASALPLIDDYIPGGAQAANVLGRAE